MRKNKLLFFCFFLLVHLGLSGCGEHADQVNRVENGHDMDEIAYVDDVALEYAKQFRIQNYERGYKYVKVEDGNEYVLIPEGEADTNLGFESATLIHIPCHAIYVAASSTMDQFCALDALEQVKASSTSAEDYAMKEVQDKINQEEICYVGKYKAPDYEQLLKLQTDLAVESTMIYHVPKTKEELESFHIPVLVDRSSYEENPLGRIEWIKLYGILTGKEEAAVQNCEAQIEQVMQVIEKVHAEGEEAPTVAFFYLSSNGYVNVRKPGDYVSKMIEMAGGAYALKSMEIKEENALSTMNVSWEDFFAYAKDADILIYNGTIDGGMNSLSDLLSQNPLFTEFKAVKEDCVYCSLNNMYQESSKLGQIIVDLNVMISQKEQKLTYFYKLE